MKHDLTFEQVNALLIYCALTGIIRWRPDVRRRKVKAGCEAGYLDCHGYRRIGIDGREYASHRLAWLLTAGAWPEGQVDHVNGVRNDNRATNLRIVSPSWNLSNQRKGRGNSRTGNLGVFYDTREKRYAASICLHGRSSHLGYFPCMLAASMVYWHHKRGLHRIDAPTLADLIASRSCSLAQC